MMTPYYADDLVTLYHGDCREVSDWLAADVLVTDPPYGIGYTLHRPGAHDPIQGDRDAALRDAVLEAWGDRAALVFGRWDVQRPLGTLERLIWDKNMLGAGSHVLPWRRADEEIYVLGKWPPVKPGGRTREGGTPSQHSSVIRIQALAPGAAARPEHPTPKPIPLLESLIGKCPSGAIADPFTGAGSTLVAARNLGRRAIGVEIDERYCEQAARSLSQMTLDLEAS